MRSRRAEADVVEARGADNETPGEEGRDQAGRPLPDSLRAVHTHLVQRRWRDSLSFLVSGAIAAAEHVPKIIACGADAVVLDWVPIIAWGCSLWADKGNCPVSTS